RDRHLHERALPLSVSPPPSGRQAIRRHRRFAVTDATIVEQLARVRARIAATGRNPDEVAIVAVTKGFDVSVCRLALQAGLRMLGENRVQEALKKMEELPEPHWHLIGHLQTNKVKQAAGRFALIQTMDSVRLAEAIASQAPRRAVLVDV